MRLSEDDFYSTFSSIFEPQQAQIAIENKDVTCLDSSKSNVDCSKKVGGNSDNQVKEKDGFEVLRPKGKCIVDGHYTIERKLGQGAFGRVYLAKDNISDTMVAIKMVPNEVSRIASELSDLKRNFKLVHPNIATMRTLEYDKELKKYYLVMEYVAGKNLGNFRKNLKGRLVSVIDAIKISRQLACAIDHAHRKGILHRDIKPENAIINDLGVIKLLDFGLACQLRSTVMKLTLEVDSNVMVGTRPYMASEQFKGKRVGPTTDIYALGVIFYEMVSGQLPFYSDDVELLKSAVCTEKAGPLPQLNKKQNKALKKVLAKDSKARYETAMDFVAIAKVLPYSWSAVTLRSTKTFCLGRSNGMIISLLCPIWPFQSALLSCNRVLLHSLRICS